MPLTDATLNLMGTYLSTIAGYLTLHSADPGTSGANLVTTDARVAASWAVDSDGDLTLTAAAAFTGAPPNSPVYYLGLWSDPTAGTFRGGLPLTGDNQTTAAGGYSVNQVTVTGTSQDGP
jgi:hypothetical protein